jgi:beta-N-acetylhexosaminidase
MRLACFTLAAVAVLALALAGGAAGSTAAGDAPKPAIVWKPIPFGDKRKAQMEAYSKRHYGTASWRLAGPKVIVEHYTGSNSFSSAFATFKSDAPNGELRELPGVCAHFIIDQDGTIYQLVRLTVRCRHAVGLNYTAIGIEHVGTSDAQILGNRRQLAASLSLTLWLMDRFGISHGNVIGHNENRESPYHHELYRSWRCQTHGDFVRESMQVYRAKLKRRANRHGVPIGPAPRWVDSGC